MADDIVTRLVAFHGLPRCTAVGECVVCDGAVEIERLNLENDHLHAAYMEAYAEWQLALQRIAELEKERDMWQRVSHD